MKYAFATWIAWGGIYGTLRCLVFISGYFFGPYSIQILNEGINTGLNEIAFFLMLAALVFAWRLGLALLALLVKKIAPAVIAIGPAHSASVETRVAAQVR